MKISSSDSLTVSVDQATFFLSSSRFLSLSFRVGVVEWPETCSASTTTVSDPVDVVVCIAQAEKSTLVLVRWNMAKLGSALRLDLIIRQDILLTTL